MHDLHFCASELCSTIIDLSGAQSIDQEIPPRFYLFNGQIPLWTYILSEERRPWSV